MQNDFLNVIDSKINQIKANELPVFSFNLATKITNAKRIGETIFIRGTFFKGKGKINYLQNKIDFDTKIVNSLKFVALFIVVFFLAFLVSENVTINGNNIPTILEKVIFVTIALVLFSVPVFILLKLKQDFTLVVEKEFNGD